MRRSSAGRAFRWRRMQVAMRWVPVKLGGSVSRRGNCYDLVFRTVQRGLDIPRGGAAPKAIAVRRTAGTSMRVGPGSTGLTDFWTTPTFRPRNATPGWPAAMLAATTFASAATPGPSTAAGSLQLANRADRPPSSAALRRRCASAANTGTRTRRRWCEVRSPYAETTTIRDGQGRPSCAASARAASLSRVPELAGLQASFGAMLAGDAPRSNGTTASGAAGTRQHWTPNHRCRAEAALAGEAARHRPCTGAARNCAASRPNRAAARQRTLLASAARAADGVADNRGAGRALHRRLIDPV